MTEGPEQGVIENLSLALLVTLQVLVTVADKVRQALTQILTFSHRVRIGQQMGPAAAAQIRAGGSNGISVKPGVAASRLPPWSASTPGADHELARSTLSGRTPRRRHALPVQTMLTGDDDG